MFKALPAFLLALLFATVVSAEPPEGKGKKDEQPVFVLMDCGDLSCGQTPKAVGTVVTVDASTQFVLTYVPFTDSQGETRNVGLLVARSEILSMGSGGSEVLFDGFDCSGSAWIILGNSPRSLFPAFPTARVVNDTDGGDVRALYVATDEEPILVDSLSTARSTGCFSPNEDRWLAVPAEKLADDLHATFPPPFTLEVN